mgnify:CR=1 FL=1
MTTTPMTDNRQTISIRKAHHEFVSVELTKRKANVQLDLNTSLIITDLLSKYCLNLDLEAKK